MRFIQVTIPIFAAASGLVALATAKPVPNWKAGGIAIPLTRHSSLPNSNKSIDLRDAISSHGMLVEEKIRSALDNYEINTGSIHPFAVKRSESGLGIRGASVPLTTYLNEIWIGEISIGTPPQTLKVCLDTGAADMWVLETGCSGISADRKLWYSYLSNSAVDERKSFQFTYGDGSIIRGTQFTDEVTIGGFTADPQAFGSATSFSSLGLEGLEIEYPADGLLGLAFPSISKLGVDPLFQSLANQKRLINPAFSLKLSSSGAGEMYVGGANSMLYKGDIAYTPVTHPGLWQVSMNDVRVNGDPILVNVPAILDTGANYIYGEWDQVAELYDRIGGKIEAHEGYGFFHLPCNSFPTMSFTFGGKTFEIPPEVLRLRPVTQGSPDCFSAVVARSAPYAFWSIGITFLQGVYTVFDYTTLQVGFAELA